eukprot:1150500-Pelagomonas_calceolata.AAC.4
MSAYRPGLPISMQQRTRVAGILGLPFTAALLHDATQHLFFSHKKVIYYSFGTWLPGLLPYALPQGIGKTTHSSARFTRLRRVDVKSRPLDIAS